MSCVGERRPVVERRRRQNLTRSTDKQIAKALDALNEVSSRQLEVACERMERRGVREVRSGVRRCGEPARRRVRSGEVVTTRSVEQVDDRFLAFLRAAPGS